MKVNTQHLKTCGTQKGSPEREVHSNTGLPRKDRNISNKQPNPTSTRTGGTTTKLIPQKYKGLKEITTNSYMPRNLKT